ncbi:LysR substrate-binding domain-containing protein [Pigmentiphaga aceris]|nr:LysR substrate-binding domain-containing protein [Pigmentiphaga aceris]
MNLSQVEAFRAVMLSGSTTAAARVLHTSQPNVSRSISQLEKAIGLQLFERSPGKLTPTEEGLAFFDEVQRSFLGLEKLDEAAGKIKRFGTGLLRIAAVSTIALGLLPRAIKRFTQVYPDVGISIHMGHSSVIAQWIDAHMCDMGIVSQLSNQAISGEPDVLYRINSVCMMAKGHRLAQKALITPADLAGETFLSVAKPDWGRAHVDRIFDEAGVTRKMNVETSYGSIICSLVAIDMGVSIGNPLATLDYQKDAIVTRPFEPAVTCEGLLIYPKGRPTNRLVGEFTKVLRQLAQEECDAVQKRQDTAGV